eukprot:366009-Chlamydomonas_euryale.AAC.33
MARTAMRMRAAAKGSGLSVLQARWQGMRLCRTAASAWRHGEDAQHERLLHARTHDPLRAWPPQRSLIQKARSTPTSSARSS